MRIEELNQKLKSHLTDNGIAFLRDNDLLKSYIREIIISDQIKNLHLTTDDKQKGVKAFMERNNLRNKEEI